MARSPPLLLSSSTHPVDHEGVSGICSVGIIKVVSMYIAALRGGVARKMVAENAVVHGGNDNMVPPWQLVLCCAAIETARGLSIIGSPSAGMVWEVIYFRK